MQIHFVKALENARISYHQGDHSKTRYWARIAASINPNIEEPWLWLAAVSSPRASIAYLEKALTINPQSQRARHGMHWAIKRVTSTTNSATTHRNPCKTCCDTSYHGYHLDNQTYTKKAYQIITGWF